MASLTGWIGVAVWSMQAVQSIGLFSRFLGENPRNRRRRRGLYLSLGRTADAGSKPDIDRPDHQAMPHASFACRSLASLFATIGFSVVRLFSALYQNGAPRLRRPAANRMPRKCRRFGQL